MLSLIVSLLLGSSSVYADMGLEVYSLRSKGYNQMAAIFEKSGISIDPSDHNYSKHMDLYLANDTVVDAALAAKGLNATTLTREQAVQIAAYQVIRAPTAKRSPTFLTFHSRDTLPGKFVQQYFFSMTFTDVGVLNWPLDAPYFEPVYNLTASKILKRFRNLNTTISCTKASDCKGGKYSLQGTFDNYGDPYSDNWATSDYHTFFVTPDSVLGTVDPLHVLATTSYFSFEDHVDVFYGNGTGGVMLDVYDYGRGAIVGNPF